MKPKVCCSCGRSKKLTNFLDRKLKKILASLQTPTTDDRGIMEARITTSTRPADLLPKNQSSLDPLPSTGYMPSQQGSIAEIIGKGLDGKASTIEQSSTCPTRKSNGKYGHHKKLFQHLMDEPDKKVFRSTLNRMWERQLFKNMFPNPSTLPADIVEEWTAIREEYIADKLAKRSKRNRKRAAANKPDDDSPIPFPMVMTSDTQECVSSRKMLNCVRRVRGLYGMLTDSN